MIKGFKKLHMVEPGSLIRFDDGVYALISEYRTNGSYNVYLQGTGEIVAMGNDEAWVAIVDMQAIEDAIFEELEYPQDE